MSRTSAGAPLSDALQSVGSAAKGKAADTAKKVKTKTVTASDPIASAFDSAVRRSWRTRRKTDRRSRVYARKRRRQIARAEHAKLRATAAAASMAEAAAKLVSGDEEVPKNKRPSAKTFAFTLLAAGATLAVIQQLLGRRHASTTSTDGSGAEGQSVPEQAAATVTELTDAAADQAPAVTDAAADQAAAVTDAAAEKVSELSDTTANKTKKTAAKATTPRKRTARTTTKASRSTAAGETPSGGAG